MMETGLELGKLLRADVNGRFRQRIVSLIESCEERVRRRVAEGVPQSRYATIEALLQALAAAKTIALEACLECNEPGLPS